jgi:hypothetical protein
MERSCVPEASAWGRVASRDQARRLGEVFDLGMAEAPQDPQDLLVLATLEHRDRHEEPKECLLVAAP